MNMFEFAMWHLAITWAKLKRATQRTNCRVRLLLGFFLPGLTVVSVPYNKMTLTLRADGWLIFSDGSSDDAMPLTWAQPNYIEAVVRAMGYNPEEVIEYSPT